MKKLFILLILLFSVFIVSCGEKNPIPDTKIEYNVRFEDTNLQDVKIESGKSLSQPQDPSKDNSIFGGWYMDEKFNTIAKFPIVVNNDIVLYAKFYDYSEAFELAREKIIGEMVEGYEYDYTIELNVSYNGLSLKGNTIGNTKYNKNNDIQFYDEQSNAGVLFFDGSKYKIKNGTTVQKISVNSKNEITKFESEEVGSDYKYDSSSLAKPLFEYSNDKLKSIEKTSILNEYKLNTSFNVSSAISLIGNHLNHPIVERAIGELPETSVDTGIYVKFSNGEIETYKYEMSVNVTNLTLKLEYNLQFKDVDGNPTISPKQFSGLSYNINDINKAKEKYLEIINKYMNLEKSSYNFSVKTGLDYGLLSNEINSSFVGNTNRKIIDGNVYFHNDIEIDSDYKNSDLYKDQGINDIHIKKTKLTNGDVYIIEKKLLKDSTYLQDGYINDINDNYHLLNVLNCLNNISFVHVTSENGKENTHSIGLKTESVEELLKWFNNNLCLDPLNNSDIDVKVFGDFEKDSIKEVEVEIKLIEEQGNLKSISINFNGVFESKLPNSKDFSVLKEASFNISYLIEVSDNYEGYEPFDEVNDAK